MNKPKVLYVTDDFWEKDLVTREDGLYQQELDIVHCSQGEFRNFVDKAYSKKTSFDVIVFALGLEHIYESSHDLFSFNTEYLFARHQEVFGIGRSDPGIVLVSTGQIPEILFFASEIKRQTHFQNVLALQKPCSPWTVIDAVKQVAMRDSLAVDSFLEPDERFRKKNAGLRPPHFLRHQR